MDGVEILLCVIGAFYAFAGYVATRSAVTAHFIDLAIAAISSQRPRKAETAQNYWLLGAAGLVFAGGITLVFLLDIAVWLFLVSAAGQALYLHFLAPRYFDVEDPPDELGRRQSTNAFVIYLASTAFVVWAYAGGELSSWREADPLLLALPAAALAAHVGYVLRLLTKSPEAPSTSSSFSAWSSDGPERRSPSECKRIKVMADYQTHPLWALDADCYGDIAPEDLGLSPELTKDLNDWADAFTASLDPDNPAVSRWSEDESMVHEAQARPLAIRLAREKPDRTIYIMGDDVGVVEVRADETM